MKVIIVAGGTGGHLFPGLTVARKLKEKEKDSEVIFVGRKSEWERDIVVREGFEFISIAAGGWLGKSLVRKLCSTGKAITGFLQSFFILKRLRPRVVMGMGGYISGPFVLVAWLFRFPTIIHEQNSVPGFTNRILSRFANEIAVSFPGSSRFFPPKKVRVTGNPVREEIWKIRSLKQEGKSKRTLLIMGGSQGAHKLNLALIEVIDFLKDKMNSWQIIHLSGREDYELMVRTYKRAGMKAMVYPFLHRMEEAYQEADLVIARAGATSVAEIIACGLPAIFIPYPLATEHHQEENARWLEKAGAAITIREKELSGKKFAETILNLIADGERLSRMAENSKSLGHPGAAEAIVARVIALAAERQGIK